MKATRTGKAEQCCGGRRLPTLLISIGEGVIDPSLR